ncbi:MAG: sigma factor-like helix-turn-helix DNA-binding protein [Xanthomonadales bacterium]
MQNELAALGNGAHALAIQILGNPDDAADAVHDAFAQVLARPYSDLSYAEIAAVLGLAPGTVMSRLHRARLALRERLERSDDD